MGLTDRFRTLVSRADPQITLNQYLGYLQYASNLYPLGGLNQSLPGEKQEEMDGTFAGYVQSAYKSNGVVFACILARQMLFTEATFQWRQRRNGRPGDLFGNADLGILENPWPGGTTGDLLGRMLQHADIGGNAFVVRRPNRLRILRPDWVSIVLGSETDSSVDSIDIDADVLGYIYHPGGRNSGEDPVPLMRDEVAHFAPIPDPEARYRGMSWFTPIAREIMGDSAATSHKLRFFENGATPNMVVKVGVGPLAGPLSQDKFREWVDLFKKAEPSGLQAYKTLYLDAGSDATVVGANLRQMDFKTTQGAGETRIAAAAGVPPIVVGLSEGLSAATYSNYGQAMRRFGDLWGRPMWRNVAGSLETIVPPPPRTQLWVDTRDIAALRIDQKDAAEIQQVKASSIETLVRTGYKADAAVKAVEAEDMGILIGEHTGLFSVQLQAPGSVKMPAGEVPGETPVGTGTKPAVLPGDTSTKPLTSGNGKAAIPK